MSDSHPKGFSQTGFQPENDGFSQGGFQSVSNSVFRSAPQQQQGYSQSGFRDEDGNTLNVPDDEAFKMPASATREKRPAPPQPKKRIIICCDGTWQSSAHGTQTIPSNVAKMSRSIASWYVDENGLKAPQLVYYDAGVGTAMGWLEAKWTGAFGGGLDENVCEAYNFLVNNYSPGDELFFFGFSRGAYTVRACAGLVCRAGICKPRAMGQFWEMYAMYKSIDPSTALEKSAWGERWEAEGSPPKFTIKVKGEDWEFTKGAGADWLDSSEKNVKIKVVGVWDTVGSLGYPDNVWVETKEKNKPYGFHNTDIHSQIENAFHALALEEHRKAFGPTLWSLPENSNTNLIQCWFPGVHINVGGGSGDGMKDIKQGSDNPDGPKDVTKPRLLGSIVSKAPAKSKGDLEIMSITTFFWMVDRCVPFLRFQIEDHIMNDYYKALDKIMRRAKEHPNTHGHYGGWGIAPIIDSYEGIMTAAGSEARTPGHYFLNHDPEAKDAAEHEENPAHRHKHRHKQTNEYMHPVVYHTFEQVWEPSEKIPEALQGFRREPLGPGLGHHWIKTYKANQPGILKRGWSYLWGKATPSDSENDLVSIPEFVIPQQGWHKDGFYWVPYERELITAASNRSMRQGGYMPPEEREKLVKEKADEMKVDNEGLEFLQKLDEDNKHTKEFLDWRNKEFTATNPDYQEW
ncbi:peptidoglycan binding domain containing protein [Paraphaeosphaeria sporulosa]